MIHRFALSLWLVIVLYPTSAWSYTLRYGTNGDVVRWRRSSVELYLDTSLLTFGPSGTASQALQNALTAWDETSLIGMTVSVVEGDGSIGYLSEQTNSNNVEVLFDNWPFEPGYAAVTIVTYQAGSGTILDADIAISGDQPWSSGGTPEARQLDLQDSLTHEMGHFFGLAHSDVPTATMYGIAEFGSVARRSLDSDDVDALIAAYGSPNILGRSVATAGCSATGRPAEIPPLVPLVAAVILVLRSRRHL